MSETQLYSSINLFFVSVASRFISGYIFPRISIVESNEKVKGRSDWLIISDIIVRRNDIRLRASNKRIFISESNTNILAKAKKLFLLFVFLFLSYPVFSVSKLIHVTHLDAWKSFDNDRASMKGRWRIGAYFCRSKRSRRSRRAQRAVPLEMKTRKMGEKGRANLNMPRLVPDFSIITIYRHNQNFKYSEQNVQSELFW